VEQAVPGDRARTVRRPGREAQGRVGPEDARADQAGAEDSDQARCPGRGHPRPQRPAQADRGGDGHGAGQDEVGDLDEAETARAEQAPLVPGQVEALAGQGLGQ
jgi:hypothetical protein